MVARDPRIGDWPYRWVRWRDFRLPDSTDDAVATLREAYLRAEAERVEIACGGGIGRTGTALAVLAVRSGVDADCAVAWVRGHYHRRAVETRRSDGGSARSRPRCAVELAASICGARAVSAAIARASTSQAEVMSRHGV